MAGSRTVINDDPSLTVRHVEGRNPFRVVIDRKNKASATSKVFDGTAPTLLLTTTRRKDIPVEQQLVGPNDDPLNAMLEELQRRTVRSVLVEGGAELLGHFLSRGLWDEVRMISGEALFGGGTQAPALDRDPVRTMMSGPDRIDYFTNGTPVADTWAW